MIHKCWSWNFLKLVIAPLCVTDGIYVYSCNQDLTYWLRDYMYMKDLFITLNTSLSGSFNEAMVTKVGCDRFISKFQVEVAQNRLREALKK